MNSKLKALELILWFSLKLLNEVYVLAFFPSEVKDNDIVTLSLESMGKK